jgi:hypothetical protein
VDEVAQATPAEPVEEERRTTPVELLWDLVFVFAITQVTTLLWRELPAALLVLFAVGGGLAAWALAVAVVVLVAALCVVETESARRVVTKGSREASAVR